MIAASDGVWDDLSDEEACMIVASVRAMNQEAAATNQEKMVQSCPALALCQEAYRRGSTDNITAVVVEFTPPAGSGVAVGGGVGKASMPPASKL